MGLTFKLGTAPQVTTNYIPKANSNSFSNSLIFDNGSNIGIGASTFPTSSNRLLFLNAPSGAAAQFLLGENGTSYAYLYGYGGDAGLFTSAAIPLIFGTNSAERMRITGAGNVGIGTSSPNYLLDVNGIASSTTEYRLNASFTRVATKDSGGGFGGGYNFNWNNGSPIHDSTGALSGYGYASDGSVRFYSNSSAAANTAAPQRVTITNNGQIVLNTTGVNPITTNSTTDQYFLMNGAAGKEVMTQYYNPTASNWFVGIRTTSGLSSTSGFHIYSSLYGNDVMGLYANGNYDFAGSDVSDRRLKENIKTIEINAIDTIMQLVPKTYIMTSNPDVKRAGFIAQEVQEILPDLINGVEGEDEFLGLDYNGLLAYSIKAIQELSAKVSSLENKS
jgi:hypothetical protein